MTYDQAKPIVEKLYDIAILYHASPNMLRMKLYDVLDEFLPTIDEGCMHRGCIAVDNFKEKTK